MALPARRHRRRALEFVILTAARTGEVIGATWAEIDLDRQGVDGAGRADEGRQAAPRATLHRALAILRSLADRARQRFVFIGARTRVPDCRNMA